ncbi:MAG: 16S rRNA (cytosine(1402)-N(4))-methyltransferase RsmH [Planctomycetes bacterium]|nr:16S rRNA (cytosine(1402)-N(4))-methyltransferase RsmH [Planctomycetota bacterium]
MNSANSHQSVLVKEIIELLNPRPGQIIVDATLGRGGHAAHFLPLITNSGQLVGIDWDPDNIKYCAEKFKDHESNTRLVCDNFIHLPDILQRLELPPVDAILLDLGISSVQLNDPDRGFSFQSDGPLDMRINHDQPLTAATVVNSYKESELQHILHTYGEERWSRRIARNIVRQRREKKIIRTNQLATLIRRSVPPRRTRIHPATRSFQALRIEVNRELTNLEKFLSRAEDCLKPGGRLAVVSFHSLEDRLVKHNFQAKSRNNHFKIITKKPITPRDTEISVNPRARSAKLRVAERI